MSPETPRRHPEALAAQAQARSAELAAELERRRGRPAGPGDLFVLQATAGLPMEWAILESGTEGKLLAVPADAGPPAGTADVEVPPDAPGGPLSLRCRFPAWLDGALLVADLRSGVIAEAAVAEARHRIHQIASGSLDGSPLAEEVDADPEYADWIRDVPERALELAAAARPAPSSQTPGFLAPPRPRDRSWGVPHSLAAALALVAIGLSLWVVALRREVSQLSEPISNIASGDIGLGEDVRGGLELPVPREASHILLSFTVDPSIGSQDGYLEIVNRFGESVWRSERLRLTPEHEIPLVVPRQRLPYGDYKVRAFPAAGFGAPTLAEEPLRIKSSE